jgi:hypothetical protein
MKDEPEGSRRLQQNTLAALVASGLARPARRRVADLDPPLPAYPSQPCLTELLAEARMYER